MNIVLSYIGELPKYILYCLYQIRLYSKLPIYLIYNDYSSSYLDIIQKKFNVFLVKYNEYNKSNFNILNKYKNNFLIVHNLGKRKELFFRSFERFYLLNNFMDKNSIINVLFLEIDNLIYQDPSEWISVLENHEIAFMIDNKNRVSTGISYFKNSKSVKKLINYFDNDYLKNIKNIKCPSEMGAIYYFIKIIKIVVLFYRHIMT